MVIMSHRKTHRCHPVPSCSAAERKVESNTETFDDVFEMEHTELLKAVPQLPLVKS